MVFYTGLVIFILFLACMSYSIAKRHIKIKKKYLFVIHCVLSFLVLSMSIFHVILSGTNIKFTFGFVSLFLLVITIISGILLKFLNKNKMLRHVHIIIAILTCLCILTHFLIKVL